METSALDQPEQPLDTCGFRLPERPRVPVGGDHRRVYGVYQDRRTGTESGHARGDPLEQGGHGQRQDGEQDGFVLGQHRTAEQQAGADRADAWVTHRGRRGQPEEHQVPEQYPQHHRRFQQDPVVLPDAERVQGEEQARGRGRPMRAQPRGQQHHDDGRDAGQQRVEHAHLIDLRHQSGGVPEQPLPSTFEVEEARSVQQEHLVVEPREPSGRDTAAERVVDDLVPEEVERIAVQGQPDDKCAGPHRRRQETRSPPGRRPHRPDRRPHPTGVARRHRSSPSPGWAAGPARK